MSAQGKLGLVMRPARSGDYEGVLALHIRALRPLGLEQTCDAHLVTFLERVGALDRNLSDGGGYVVVSLGPRIVAGAGFCQGRPPYEQVLHARGLRAITGGPPRVRGAVVDPDFAGYGIGGLLMRWIEQRALARRHETLRLTAARVSEPFYASMGWWTGGRLWLEVAPGLRLEAVEMHKDLLARVVPEAAPAHAEPALLH